MPLLPLDPPVTPDAHYFSVEELRGEQEVGEEFTESEIEANRNLAEEVIEQACGVAFLPRRHIERIEPLGNGALRLSRRLVRELEAFAIDAEEWTEDEIADRLRMDGSYVIGLGVWGLNGRRITTTYTHGYDVPPLRIRRAAMIATRIWTEKGPIDDRAIQLETEVGGRINLLTPGKFGSITGIPEVDAAIQDYRYTGYLIP